MCQNGERCHCGRGASLRLSPQFDGSSARRFAPLSLTFFLCLWAHEWTGLVRGQVRGRCVKDGGRLGGVGRGRGAGSVSGLEALFDSEILELSLAFAFKDGCSALRSSGSSFYSVATLLPSA